MAAPRSGFVVLILFACAGGAALRLAQHREEPEPIELRVREIVRVGGRHIVVLSEKEGTRALPIPISRADAALIDRALNAPGGLTEAALSALGGRVLRGTIDEISLERGVVGHLSVGSGAGELRIEAAAAEVLALALQAGAPIVADRDLVDEVGISPDDLRGKNARERTRENAPAPVLGI